MEIPSLDSISKSNPRAATLSEQQIWQRLFVPVDIASLVFFRVAFGAIMFWEVWRYFSNGWIQRYWIDPTFHFSYYGFDWIQPWPGQGMYLHFAGLGILSLCILVGYRYRLSTTLFFLGFSYVFLLDQVQYLNHFYLICLLSFSLIFIPADKALSVDAAWRPDLRSDFAPTWALWLLRIQIGIVYFYGGLAKLNSDWLRGEPMRTWLANRTDFPVLGSYFTAEWMVALFNYGGLFFDLLIVPFLLWRRTRPYAFAVAVLFHLLNARLFSIGIFPWFMIAATALFFNPNWPRFGGKWWPLRDRAQLAAKPWVQPARLQTAVVSMLIVFVALQLLVPLRHHLYEGDVNWTEEGHRFAWHMKLRDKTARAQFTAIEPGTGRTWNIDPQNDLTSRQYIKMSTRPDMILQYSHYIADRLRALGYNDIQVYATVWASLNGRESQWLIDSSVDLAAQSRSLRTADWILRPELD